MYSVQKMACYKRSYSCFFGTDLEILLKGLKVDTLYLIGGFTDACGGCSVEAHNYALKAMQYLQCDALTTVADVESAL